jgi:hypothetical protein
MPPGSPPFGRLVAMEDGGTPSFHSSAASAEPTVNAQPSTTISHRLSMRPIPTSRPYRVPGPARITFNIRHCMQLRTICK